MAVGKLIIGRTVIGKTPLGKMAVGESTWHQYLGIGSLALILLEL